MPNLAWLPRKHESWLMVVIVAMVIVLSIVSPAFLTLRNAQDLITANAFTSILAAGLLIVLISGGIDISFTATATVAQYVAMTIANAYDVGWIAVILIGSGVGIALGTINATLIHVLRVPSIIATLGTLNVFYGALVFVTRGNYIYTLPDWFSSGINLFEWRDAESNYYSLNFQMIATVLVLGIAWFILRRTRLGRQIRAFGGNPEAAKRIGLPIMRIQFFVYGWMGLCAGIASLVQAQLAQSVAPTVLVGRELDVLAAVVLGGASLAGGVGSILGTVLGLALVIILENGLILIGVSSYWSDFATGIVILIAVSATARRSIGSKLMAPA
jgi:simple sugar transport system permease protein